MNNPNNIMKQFFAACALMLGIATMGMAQEVVNGPSITLDKDVHDYGTIQQGADGNCLFTVTNSGTDVDVSEICELQLTAKSPVAWATVEMDAESNFFLIFGDRDPHRGCATDADVSGQMGTEYVCLNQIFGETNADISDEEMGKIVDRWNGGTRGINLARHGNLLASVVRDNPSDGQGWSRNLNRVSSVFHGNIQLKRGEKSGHSLLAVWGTPHSWVEIWSNGEVRASCMHRSEILKTLSPSESYSSIGVLRGSGVVYGQSVVGL